MMREVGTEVYGIVGLGGLPTKGRGLGDHMKRFPFPQDLSGEELERAQRDCEILAGRLLSSREELSALLHAVVRNDRTGAKQRVEELGLTEEDFQRQGGGLFWLIVIAVLLYATDAY